MMTHPGGLVDRGEGTAQPRADGEGGRAMWGKGERGRLGLSGQSRCVSKTTLKSRVH